MSMRRHRVQGGPATVWAVVEVDQDGNHRNHRLYSKLSTARTVRTQSQNYSGSKYTRFIILESTTIEWEEVQ